MFLPWKKMDQEGNRIICLKIQYSFRTRYKFALPLILLRKICFICFRFLTLTVVKVETATCLNNTAYGTELNQSDLLQLALCFQEHLAFSIRTKNGAKASALGDWQHMQCWFCRDLKSSASILEWCLKWIHLWSAVDVRFDALCFAENY